MKRAFTMSFHIPKILSIIKNLISEEWGSKLDFLQYIFFM